MDELERRIRAARPTGGELPLTDQEKREVVELEQRIRAARPPRGHRSDPLPERAKREMDELLVGSGYVPVYFVDRPSGVTRSRFRRFGPAWLAAAAVVVVAFVASSMLGPGGSQPAGAATPPLLVVEPLADPGAEVLVDLARAARGSDFSVPAEGEDVTIGVQSWVLHMEIGADGELDASATVVSPEVHTVTFGADGSMSQVVTAGQAYDETGETVEQDPPIGTVLWTFDEGPGGYEPLFTTPAPRHSDEGEEFLTGGGGLPAGESASNAFWTINYLLSEQRLDGLQTAALLDFVATLPDYTIAGTTTDRLGSPALVLTAQRADGEFSDSLLLDPETGQILAFETTYIGTSRPDLTAPAVSEYHAWEN